MRGREDPLTLVLKVRVPLRPAELAVLLGCSLKHIRKLIRTGHVRCIRDASGRKRISLSEFARLARRESVEWEVTEGPERHQLRS